MKVAVTGGTGLLGSALVGQLVARDADVTVLVRPGRLRSERAQALAARKVEVDLFAERDVAGAVAGADVLYHLVLSRSSHRPFFDEADERTNLDILGSVLAAVARAGIRRIVYTSSVSVYGSVAPSARPAGERAPLAGDQPYPEFKKAAERIVGRLEARTGAEYVIVRPAFIYGRGVVPAQWYLRTLATRPRWALAVPGPISRLLETGRVSHWVHVQDAARALELAGSRAAAAFRCYNIVGPRAVRRAEMVAIALAVLGRTAPAAGPPSRTPALYDGRRAHRELGFEPLVSVEEGVAEVLTDTLSRSGGTGWAWTRAGWDRLLDGYRPWASLRPTET